MHDVVFCNKTEEIEKQNNLCLKMGINKFNTKDGYIESNDETNFDIVYWFDSDTNNYHITPCKSIAKDKENISGIRKKVCDALEEKGFQGVTKNQINGEEINWVENKYFLKRQGGLNHKAWNYYYIRAFSCWKSEKFEYLILFSRMYLREDDLTVSRYVGKVQFFRYKVFGNDIGNDKTNINWNSDKFDMMYPHSGEDGSFCYNKESKHCVYNPCGLTTKSTSEEIAREFIAFMNSEIIDFSEEVIDIKSGENYEIKIIDFPEKVNNHIYGSIHKKEQTP